MTPRFEESFAKMMGSKHAVAMNCAMSVLHASVIAAGAGAGSEVICDSEFIFGALAALYNNAVPRFVDLDPVTHCVDPDRMAEAINERTRAVVVTHAYGFPADMDRIVQIAHRYDLVVIEDCAHSILATYKGRHAGTIGDIGSFSFQSSKQMSLGDGGMATTNDDKLAEMLDLHAGAPTSYAVAYGVHHNYRMNEQTSAIGIGQLEKLPMSIAGMQQNASYYTQAVADCPWLVVQKAPGAQSSFHYWAATFEGEGHGITLDAFKEAAKEAQCGLSIGYTGMPSYKHPAIKDKLAHAFHCKDHPGIEYPDGLCPVAERIIPRVVLAYTLGPEDKAKEQAGKLHALVEKLGK
jgi:dTDP-4-amino-4,6-dideoxygalactose transaminase